MLRIPLILALLGGAATVRSALAWERADTPAPRESAKDDLKKLQGTWIRTSMEVEGEPIPAENFQDWKAIYDGDRLTLTAGDVVRSQGKVTLDPTVSPKRMDTANVDGAFAGQVVPGIYRFESDTLKVCFARPGQERPTEFTTKRGSGFLYCVYKREKP